MDGIEAEDPASAFSEDADPREPDIDLTRGGKGTLVRRQDLPRRKTGSSPTTEKPAPVVAVDPVVFE
jgi:hypothetical protein